MSRDEISDKDAKSGKADVESSPSPGSRGGTNNAGPSTPQKKSIGRRVARSIKGAFGLLDPPPPRESLDDADYLPDTNANIFSTLTFGWLNPLMSLGYARTLEATDLYKLQEHRSSAVISEKITTSFDARKAKVDAWNARLDRGEIHPGVMKKVWWGMTGNGDEKEREWRKGARKRASLALSMNDSVKLWFWTGGILKVLGDTSLVTSPLLIKAIINFATDSYNAHLADEPAPLVGKGIGYCFGLLALQIFCSLCQNHFIYHAMSTGVLLRGGLITAIYSRSLRLTTRARSSIPNGRLINHISTDVSRIDACCMFFHLFWAAPFQIGVCLVQLLINLGPSALAGFVYFIVVTPLQAWIIKNLIKMRVKTMVWTDKRAKLLQELLGGMKVIKYLAWEVPFLKRIAEYRRNEMKYIRALLTIHAANAGMATTAPAVATVLAFVVYAATGHSLEAANVFSSLTLFSLIRMPLMMLPMSFSTLVDARNAIHRLQDVFEAETITESHAPEPELPNALEVKHASFSWETTVQDAVEIAKVPKPNGPGKKGPPIKVPDAPPPVQEPTKVENLFKIQDISLEIPRGSLVAIVGNVGAGKTSLLQGLLGEMRRTEGSVKFGGSVAYCSQSAWIQNATIRENICFGRPFEAERYWKAVNDACLHADLDMLPNGDMTEVGERGVSLSGGQKQRLNICRAVYADCDIMIFDDPLSALDAHVGASVFKDVLVGSPPGKTRILVTHALHFLPQVDYIYTLVDGCIAERGTYNELMVSQGGTFAKFITEFVSHDNDAEEKRTEEIEEEEDAEVEKNRRQKVKGTQLMQTEERTTGSIGIGVFKEYSKAGNGALFIPLLLLSLIAQQGAQVLSSYWLVYWEDDAFDRSSGFYMGIYAALGFAQAFTSMAMGAILAWTVYTASQRLHHNAINRVMHAPMSFFETTPIGRIMNRFSKDIDTLDNTLSDSFRMFLVTASNIVGAIVLIAIVEPWFLIAVAFCVFLYAAAAAFYRASAREIKRLDAILRSSLYSHFSESLSGIATIRAYGESDRFNKENRNRVDIENRAYWITVTNQRWLGVRLDFFGAILAFVVAILTVGTRFTISPAQTGVILSYVITAQQSFGMMIRQLAEVENDMNSVERVVHHAKHVEQEAPHLIEDRKPPTSWPSIGRIELKDVQLRYRPELPPVLKGITMSIQGGEKIGIVGRTGAGKSSIMTALFRLVEISSGSIVIDSEDISKLGLTDVRQGLAIIPQDATLFSGTLRTNLDPFGLHDDARLWDALKRAYLVDQDKALSTGVDEKTLDDINTRAQRFTLDSQVDDEGANLSIGQRSLVSLARALVKDSKIIILDEATASVDYETDRNIQATIAKEFRDRTILCIAHRLRTIISYDRICVLDAGQIAELDTPENLYHIENGIFRSMCERSGSTLEDLKKAAKEVEFRKDLLGDAPEDIEFKL